MSQEYVYGYHAVQAVLATKPQLITQLYLQKNREDKRQAVIVSTAKDLNIPVTALSRTEFENLLGESVHQGVAAVCSGLVSFQENDLSHLMASTEHPLLILILDGVQDPHNLGACLRSANAMGVDFVIAPKNRAVGMTSVVRKVACGAAEMTPFIQVTNLSRTLGFLKEEGVWLVGMAAEASDDLSAIDLKGHIAIVMGSEGAGLRRLTREHCDYLAKIPMLGTVSSLNVSVATGMCLYEVIRQRLS